MSYLKWLQECLSTIIIFVRIIFLIYYIVTIPFRLCFLPDLDILNDSIGLAFVDYFVDLFYILDAIYPYLSNIKIHMN